MHFSEIDGGDVRHLHLCADCAREKELAIGGDEDTPADVGEAPPSSKPLLHVLRKLLASESEDVNIKCAQCGHTYADFRSSGRLGCGHCYEAFADKLEPLLRHMHGSSKHTGKVPECMDERVKLFRERNRLKQSLAAAVESEAFERAAALRDQIQSLEHRIAEDDEEPHGSP